MSGTAISVIGAFGGMIPQFAPLLGPDSPLQAFLLQSPRGFQQANGNMIIPDVTIEENHSDRVTVTQHPVATGTVVSDHAYRNPATVTIRAGWSNSNIISAGVSGFISGGLSGAAMGLLSSVSEQRVKDIYATLQKLQFDQDAWNQQQVAVTPFTLFTGKRQYKNMVITELMIRTDHTSEFSLMVECHLQEVMIVETQDTTQPAQANQLAPSKTASATDQPDKSGTAASPGTASTLNRLLTGTTG